MDLGLPLWALMGGDRYHCLDCENVDYCTVCVRGELSCKASGHTMLRIRPSYSRKTWLTESIPLKQRQQRLDDKVCLRCASDEHKTPECDAKEPVVEPDIEAEE